MRALDITNNRYGRLTAICRAHYIGKGTRWKCKCDCGKEAIIALDSLRAGLTKSCGCIRIEIVRARSITHGNSVSGKITKELRAWSHMKGRCLNPNDHRYKDYGARGIKICDKWINNFEEFLSDMGKCPPDHSIERRNVNGNYEPSNCYWATTHVQARTRRDNIYVQYEGETMILKDYAARVGVPYRQLHLRYRTRGEDLFTATRAMQQRTQKQKL